MSEAEQEAFSSDDHEFEDNGEGEDNPQTKRRRNRVAIKENWPREITTSKRQHGEAYIGYKQNEDGNKVSHDVPRPERIMGPRCTSKYCKKSTKRNCNDLEDSDRKKLNNMFWDDMTWDQKKIYIVSLVDKHATKSKCVEDSRRTLSLMYFLYINGKIQQVCKSFFLSTLSLNEWMVLNWVKESDLGIIPAKHIRNKRRALVRPPSKLKEFNEKRQQFLRKFFDDLPKMESHYCRHQTDKLYFQPDFESLAQLYECYVQVCRENNEKPLSDCSFSNLFHSSNLSLYQPKKDRCDLCVSYEAGNIGEEEFKNHIKAKERARKEKFKDKQNAAGKAHALLMDVQAVKLLPVSNCNSYYFKSKLKMHNFTMFEMITTECMNYWWHEGEGGVVASMFVSCIIKHLETYCRDKLPVILWSDGCTYQNRNQVWSNALLDYAIRTGKDVIQKFLVKGHTQMEVNNVHMLIEKKLKKKLINLPDQYVSMTKKARRSKPLKAVLLTHKDFKNFDDSALYYYPGIRPGTKAGDPTVYDIRSLHYSPTGHISYTLDFDEKPKPLPGKRTTPTSSYLQVKPYYTERPKITQQKYNDLQDLKRMLPEKVHDFYDNLNH